MVTNPLCRALQSILLLLWITLINVNTWADDVATPTTKRYSIVHARATGPTGIMFFYELGPKPTGRVPGEIGQTPHERSSLMRLKPNENLPIRVLRGQQRLSLHLVTDGNNPRSGDFKPLSFDVSYRQHADLIIHSEPSTPVIDTQEHRRRRSNESLTYTAELTPRSSTSSDEQISLQKQETQSFQSIPLHLDTETNAQTGHVYKTPKSPKELVLVTESNQDHEHAIAYDHKVAECATYLSRQKAESRGCCDWNNPFARAWSNFTSWFQ